MIILNHTKLSDIIVREVAEFAAGNEDVEKVIFEVRANRWSFDGTFNRPIRASRAALRRDYPEAEALIEAEVVVTPGPPAFPHRNMVKYLFETYGTDFANEVERVPEFLMHDPTEMLLATWAHEVAHLIQHRRGDDGPNEYTAELRAEEVLTAWRCR